MAAASSYSPDAALLNAAGQVAFVAPLVGAGIDSTNNRAILTGPASNLLAVARTGSTALGPNLGGNIVFTSFSEAPLINDDGDLASH